MSLSEKLSKGRTFPTKDVQLCLDAALVAERDRAMEALADAVKKNTTDGRLTGVAGKAERAELDEIEERMRASVITLRVTGLPFKEYNDCVRANPPRKGRQETFNTSTFFLYTARRSTRYVNDAGELEPISDEDWARIEADLTDGEHDLLAGAVIEVNRTQGLSGVGFLGRSLPTTRSSDETSESPEA